MHVTQNTIHCLLKQSDIIGKAGMCPRVIKSSVRSQTNESITVRDIEQFLDISNKQSMSYLGYLGMT